MIAMIELRHAPARSPTRLNRLISLETDGFGATILRSHPLDLHARSNLYPSVMSTYTIGEVADRTGFSASALRYYEGIGLVQPASRTAAGYRVYDDQALMRLAFIARAKQLGCTLEEIIDLVSIWDGSHCGPVQRRFHALVTDKIRENKSRITELDEFSRQLTRAAAHLRTAPVDGPCESSCACLTTPSDSGIACTLDAGAMPGRLDDWRALLDHAVDRTRTSSGVLRVELDEHIDAAELARVVAAEQECCTFFAFAITIDQRGIALEVTAPPDAQAIVTALFGQPA